ncbi:GTPase HflX [Bauldia sp.]|uniref:GTPase HflX n=1 Tax=Bauldia sp. TaxID=2575872 RepID=UPI003BAC6C97
MPVSRAPRNHETPPRSKDAQIAEAVGLARAINLKVVDALATPLTTPRPGTLFGSGKVEEVAAQIRAEAIKLVVVDHPLSPIQQRNLEKAWHSKVIDRTGLILEIFGERAQTREGRLQVELAHLTYQRSRLVRSWTHLERQRGGFGFLGGPGETQIEADRRALAERIDRIKVELAAVSTRRRLQRRTRQRSETPLVALVGYTNAGKSTLFNALTESAVLSQDKLFATLDPTLRRLSLPDGANVVLSDTVGFVADLPTSLVAAFRATLEEVSEADLILHVRDIADAETEAQAADVASVLADLDVDVKDADRVIEVWNKIDLLPPDQQPPRRVAHSLGEGAAGPTVVSVSAISGEGLPDLLDVIEDRITATSTVYDVEIAADETARLHRLYAFGDVVHREDRPDGTVLARVRVRPSSLKPFAEAFNRAHVVSRSEQPAATLDA